VFQKVPIKLHLKKYQNSKKINLLKKNDTKIKVLGNGDLKNKLKLEVDFISKAAKKKIEDVGGSVVVKAK